MKEKHSFQNSPKAVIAFLFVALMSIGFIACSDKEDNPVNPTEPDSKDVTELLKGNWVCDLDGLDGFDFMGASFSFGDNGESTIGYFYFDEELDGYVPFDLSFTYRLLSNVQAGSKTLHQIELTPTAETIEIIKYFEDSTIGDNTWERPDTMLAEVTEHKLRLMEELEQAEPYVYGGLTYDFATVCKRGTVDIKSLDKAKTKEFLAEIAKEIEEIEKSQKQEVQAARSASKTPRRASVSGRELRKWMKDIPGTTKVRDLMLPGSHDCGTYGLSGLYMTTFGKTQLVDFSEQFAWGSRVFDLRTRYVDDGGSTTNQIFHDFIFCNNKLEKALNDIKQCLKDNPTEGVIITIKGEGNQIANAMVDLESWINKNVGGKSLGAMTKTFVNILLNSYFKDGIIFKIDYTGLHKTVTTSESVGLVEDIFYKSGMLAKFDPDMTMDDLRGKALVILQDYDTPTNGWGSIGDHIALIGNNKYFTPSGRASVEVSEQNDWDQEEGQSQDAYVDSKNAQFKAKLLDSTNPEFADKWIVNACNGYFRDGNTFTPDYVTYASRVYPTMAANVDATPGCRGICIQDYVGCNYVPHAPILKLFSFCRSYLDVGAIMAAPLINNREILLQVFMANCISAIADAPYNNTFSHQLTESMVERNFSNQVKASRVLTPTDGNFTEGKGSESYKQIFDGDPGTKWCIQMFNDIWFTTYTVVETAYAEFRSGSPVSPKGYTITTANDASVFPGRNPVKFKLLGKKNADDSYQVIDERSLDLPATNCARKSYSFSKGAASAADMQFFRIEITSIKDEDSEWMQFSEFEFDYND